MDIQRIVLFAGLAIVSYLMVLAWNEDYNQPAEPVAVEEQTANLRDAATDDEMSLPDSSAQQTAPPLMNSLLRVTLPPQLLRTFLQVTAW